MKRAIRNFFLASMLLPSLAKAQATHFIFIQADDKQQFSVSLNNKTFASSEAGYVTIPKLTDSVYQLKISFQQNKFPQVQFSCAVNNADLDFALKNIKNKGWVLLNMQTLEIIVSGTQDASKAKDGDDAFANMLSSVIDDTSLLKKQQAVTQSQTAVSPGAAIHADSIDTGSVQTNIAKDSAPQPVDSLAEKKENLTADSANNLSKQVHAADVAIDKINELTVNGKTDSVSKERKEDAVKTDSLPEKIIENQKEQNSNPFYKKIDTTAAQKNAISNANSNNQDAAPLSPDKKLPERNCSKMLSENEMEKLRKKIFTTSGDDKMIEVANKSFSGKCVTTEQVKVLASYFVNDEARLNFFSAAYPNVYDLSNFASLEKLLIDPAYKSKFRELLK